MRIIYLIDFNCLPSYIGLARIRKACESLDLDVEWEIRTFELESETGKKPTVSTVERYTSKYGISTEDALAKIAEIEQTALLDGLKVSLKDMQLTSSRDALRLCKFSQNMYPEITLRLVFEIFHSRFCKNENIADNDVLVKIAVSCGIEESMARKIIENNYYDIECFLDMEEALSNGITATPCFILEQKEQRLIIPGAFSSKDFEIAIKDFISGEINSKTSGFGSI